MIPTLFVAVYLAAVLYIGIFAFRRKPAGGAAEDYFLAGRSLGPYVFLLSLFGTHMTAFAILGSSGFSFNNGIVTFGLMASSSALIVPLLLLFIGTRLWAVGKKFGHFTPVQIFRDRWECGHIGTLIFLLQAALLVPYIIIGVIGGGTTLNVISGGLVPYWLGGLVVACVVMSYVFFGGMRGTAWVNTFQTTLFLGFGTIAVIVIGAGMGGFTETVNALASNVRTAPLLTRERVSPLFFLSYTFNPLSAIAFPHISIFCLTAKHMAQFKKTVILYPLCILLIWLPCVFLGVAANRSSDIPAIKAKQEARGLLASKGATMSPEERDDLRSKTNADDVMLLLLDRYAPTWLAGLLGAGIMAAVMASDSQILALSTMFTEDFFAYYGGTKRYGEQSAVVVGRAFIVFITAVAYAIALVVKANIFDLAIQFAFAGYSALSPLLVAALFWRGSTKWGALASTIWVASAVLGVAFFQGAFPAPAPGPPTVVMQWNGWDVLARTPGGTAVFGFSPVVPMTIISALLVWSVSLVTPKPSRETIDKYFSL